MSLSTGEARRWSLGRTAAAFIATVTSEPSGADQGSCLRCGVSGAGTQGWRWG